MPACCKLDGSAPKAGGVDKEEGRAESKVENTRERLEAKERSAAETEGDLVAVGRQTEACKRETSRAGSGGKEV